MILVMLQVCLVGFLIPKINLCRMVGIRAVLFDVIGTTVLEDEPDLINRCFQNAFMENSINVTKTQILNVRGKDKLEAIGHILSATGSPPDLQARTFASFHENLSSQISEFREDRALKEVVSFLRSKNILIGVGSGLPDSIFQLVFDHLAWQKYCFDYCAVFERFPLGRPQPFMIFDMCKQI
jgi:beta-phosphoglucomutase-like phosphatase (HAD superfamily)